MVRYESDRMAKAGNKLDEALADQPRFGVTGEMWAFLCVTKKWWLFPIVIVFALLGALIMLSGTAAAPFIYTLF